MTRQAIRRVGLLVNGWPAPRGEPTGTGRNAEQVADELTRRGFAVSVLVTTSTDTTYQTRRDASRHGVTVRIVEIYRPTYRSSYRNVAAEEVLRQWLAEAEPDVVHIVHPGEVGVAAPAIVAASGVPVVLTACDAYYACHMGHLVNPRERRPLCVLPIAEPECARCMAVGTGVEPGWMQPLAHERRMMGTVSVAAGPVIADSAFIGRELKRAFPMAKVSDLPLAVTMPQVAEPPSASGQLRLGFFGVPSWRKGLDLLLDAIDGIDDVHLEIHGPTTFRDEPDYSEELVARAGRLTNVTWVGPYQPSEAVSRMKTVDVIAVPSRAESLPGVVKEALAAGRPVLGSRISGIPELVNEATGWLFTPEDATDLRRIIERLSGDTPAVREMRPVLDLPVSAHVERLLEHYQSAMSAWDPEAAVQRLDVARAEGRRNGFVARDELYQLALMDLSHGRRRGVSGLVRSLHRSASDRIWVTLTLLIWWPAKFDRAFEQVLKVQAGHRAGPSRWSAIRAWLRLVI